jgi:hypothetical protein
LAVCVLAAYAQEEKKKPEYIGVKKCKMCHSKAKMGGIEYLKWEKGSHAKAYEQLKSEESKAAGAEMGVEDPASSEKCLACHITTLKFENEDMRKGVGCERCHGPGSEYKSMSVMKDYEKSVAAGMTNFHNDEGKTDLAKVEKLCRECHGLEHKDKNPFAKEFKFEEAWAKVKHDEETLKKEFPSEFE